ncbi:MAG: YdcH family protein [Rhizomicrobium sp.]
MTEAEEQQLRAKLAELKQEHLDLDAAIGTMIETSGADQLRLTRMKKRKLQLKDLISTIEGELVPDIIA